MSEYQGCHKCKYGNNQPTDYPCLECEHNRAIDHYEPMTNADRIRNMTDKELADYIFGVSIGNADCVLCNEECDICELTDEQCKEKTLKWLQAEAEGDSE